MASFNTNEEICGYLDKISRLYPSGIPRSLIPKVIPTVAAAQPRCALLYVVEEGAASEQLATLAGAICTKGLRVPLDHCVVRSVVSADIEGEGLAKLVSQVGAAVVVLCGSSLAPGEVAQLGGAVILTSFSLAQVGQNAEVKRQFWDHLKLVIPRIHSLGGV